MLSLRAPAKLNLGLRVLGLRPDGYHLIESLFAPIELWDDVQVEILPGASKIDLQVESAPGSGLPPALSRVPSGPTNLVFQAAAAFCREYDVQGRVRIRLVKRIPAGAGLGGGSSDAAAVLRGLAALIGGGEHAPSDMEALALTLGADVPFFLAPQPALVRGIGEQIEPLEGLPPLDVVVANPGISLATAEVYRAADALGGALTPSRAGSTMRAFGRLGLCRGSSEEGSSEEGSSEEGSSEKGSSAREAWKDALGDLLVNDLEPAARRLSPPIGRLAGQLRECGALAVSMTGSGATVFGIFASRSQAAQAARTLRGWRGEGQRLTADERPAEQERADERIERRERPEGRERRRERRREGRERHERLGEDESRSGEPGGGEPARAPRECEEERSERGWVQATRLASPAFDI